MKSLQESLIDQDSRMVTESLFDNDLVSKELTSALDYAKGHVFKIRASYGVPLFGMFKADFISMLNKQYNDIVLPTKQFTNSYKKHFGVINGFLNYLLSHVMTMTESIKWETDSFIETEINKVSKYDMRVLKLVCGNAISFAFEWKENNYNTKSSIINIYFNKPIKELISIHESLFDVDLVQDDITTLYDLINGHVIKFKSVWGEGLGWTHFFDKDAVVRVWKKEGRPELTGSYAKTTFPPDLKKFISLILKNTVVTKKQLSKMDKDGNFDDKDLNDKLEKAGIILPDGSNWGVGEARTLIRVQIGYIDGFPEGPGHGVQFKTVGIKRFKGFNTENIELSIYAYNPKRPGFGRHIWTLLTDLTIKDLLYKK